MYELKKIGKVFTSKFVGTGPSSYKKKNLPVRALTKVEKHCCRALFPVRWDMQVYIQFRDMSVLKGLIMLNLATFYQFYELCL